MGVQMHLYRHALENLGGLGFRHRQTNHQAAGVIHFHQGSPGGHKIPVLDQHLGDHPVPGGGHRIVAGTFPGLGHERPGTFIFSPGAVQLGARDGAALHQDFYPLQLGCLLFHGLRHGGYLGHGRSERPMVSSRSPRFTWSPSRTRQFCTGPSPGEARRAWRVGVTDPVSSTVREMAHGLDLLDGYQGHRLLLFGRLLGFFLPAKFPHPHQG